MARSLALAVLASAALSAMPDATAAAQRAAGCAASPAPAGAVTAAARVPGTQDSALRRRHPERYVSAAEAVARASRPEVVVVDLRRPSEIAGLRIPGALSIPPHQVKTKGFLRGRRLLLLDRGFRYRPAERTAAELAAGGFGDARIIEGGVEAWRQAGGRVIGPQRASPLRMVPPAALGTEAAFAHWRVLRVNPWPEAAAGGHASDPAAAGPGAAGRGTLQRQLKQPAARLDAGDLDRLPARAAELTRSGAGGLSPLVLIVGADGSSAAALGALLAEAAPWSLYVLEGGLAAWQAEQRRQQAMLAHRLAPPRPSGGCGR